MYTMSMLSSLPEDKVRELLIGGISHLKCHNLLDMMCFDLDELEILVKEVMDESNLVISTIEEYREVGNRRFIYNLRINGEVEKILAGMLEDEVLH